MKRAWFMAALAASVIGVVAVPTNGSADTPTTLQVAIPNNVVALAGLTEIVFIGRPTSTTPVTCAPGTPHPQTVRLVHPGSGIPGETSGVLAFHDHEIRLGSRFLVISDGAPCNADLKLYTVESI